MTMQSHLEAGKGQRRPVHGRGRKGMNQSACGFEKYSNV